MTFLILSSLLVLPATAVVNGALQDRANYEGSWAVAIPGASCPAEAPVLCDTDSITTTGCCPSGDTCFGLGGTYCCPTSMQFVDDNLPETDNCCQNPIAQRP